MGGWGFLPCSVDGPLPCSVDGPQPCMAKPAMPHARWASVPMMPCRLKEVHEKAPAEFKAYYECLDYYR